MAVALPMRWISAGSCIAPKPTYRREDRRADHVVVAVHRVDAEEQRDRLDVAARSMATAREGVGGLDSGSLGERSGAPSGGELPPARIEPTG